ncbi:hypothetical protein HanIR_Chr12g0606541 [Helianthus annuus]|nr:hypothetical protein HanIR_Chr12g0606541 [Helianthus annuus]
MKKIIKKIKKTKKVLKKLKKRSTFFLHNISDVMMYICSLHFSCITCHILHICNKQNSN